METVEAAPLGRAAFSVLSKASQPVLADLETLKSRLEAWNARLNLVGPATLGDFWGRHAWDSAQLREVTPQARSWADIGAGAGFPGLVLAILLKGEPDAKIHLVESIAKKCRFIEEVAAELRLPVEVHNARAEETRLMVEVVTARAMAPLPKLLGYAKPFLDRGATGIFLKGERLDEELAAARRQWRFDAEVLPSRSDPRGRILIVRRLHG